MTDRTCLPRTGAMILALLLSACTVGPDFVRPAPDLPATFAGAQGPVKPVAAARWHGFEDRALDALEARGVVNNLDIRQAVERIAAAQAQYGVAGAEGAPSLTAQGNYSRNRVGTAGIADFARPLLGLEKGDGDAPKGVDFDMVGIGGSASWEIDLWGRIRRRREAAGAQVAESQADADGMRLSVQAEIARTYFQWRQAVRELMQARRSLALAERAAAALKALEARGLASRADVIERESRVRTARGNESSLQEQRDRLRRALAVLVEGRPDAPLDILDIHDDEPALGPPPSSLPSQMVRSRPDILAAEARLHAATALVGAAKADFYPAISLSGLFSLDALSLKDLGWDSRNTSIGGAISLPIFSGGRLQRTLDLRKSEQRSAALAYRATVVAAWQEVEDALSSLRALNDQLELGKAERDARAVIAKTSDLRARRGETGLLPLLDAQAAAIEAEIQAQRQRTAVLLAHVQLYRALGR